MSGSDSESNVENELLRERLFKLSKEHSSRLVRMLTKLPPVKPILFDIDDQAHSPIREKPPESPIRTVEPLKPKLSHLTRTSLDKHQRQKFSSRDIELAQQNKVHINIFKRKHRHLEDMDDSLSVISQRSTKSFSRFDRVFEKPPATQDLLETQDLSFSTQDRVLLQKQMDRMEGLETQPSSEQFETENMERIQVQTEEMSLSSPDRGFMDSAPLQTQESLFHSVQLDTQATKDVKTEVEKKEEEESKQIVSTSPPIIPTQEEREPSPMIPIGHDDYDIDYGVDDDMDMYQEQEKEIQESQESIVQQPRVIQGDSFIRKKMNEPVTRYKKRLLLPHVKTKAIFQSNLSYNKKVATSVDLSKATSLFCDQLVDDLKSYKENQPEEDRGEITDKDVILLMQRQRLISDKSSLEALAQKYLPREYIDIVCQAALAYNELYPGFNQKYRDDFYYYNYDNINNDEEE